MLIETILALITGLIVAFIIIYFCCGSVVDPFEDEELREKWEQSRLKK